MRILVIEDDRKVARFIQAGLEREGHAVDVLNDGLGAAEQAHAVDYDAVVLDLMLPGPSNVNSKLCRDLFGTRTGDVECVVGSKVPSGVLVAMLSFVERPVASRQGSVPDLLPRAS